MKIFKSNFDRFTALIAILSLVPFQGVAMASSDEPGTLEFQQMEAMLTAIPALNSEDPVIAIEPAPDADDPDSSLPTTEEMDYAISASNNGETEITGDSTETRSTAQTGTDGGTIGSQPAESMDTGGSVVAVDYGTSIDIVDVPASQQIPTAPQGPQNTIRFNQFQVQSPLSENAALLTYINSLNLGYNTANLRYSITGSYASARVIQVWQSTGTAVPGLASYTDYPIVFSLSMNVVPIPGSNPPRTQYNFSIHWKPQGSETFRSWQFQASDTVINYRDEFGNGFTLTRANTSSPWRLTVYERDRYHADFPNSPLLTRDYPTIASFNNANALERAFLTGTGASATATPPRGQFRLFGDRLNAIRTLCGLTANDNTNGPMHTILYHVNTALVGFGLPPNLVQP